MHTRSTFHRSYSYIINVALLSSIDIALTWSPNPTTEGLEARQQGQAAQTGSQSVVVQKTENIPRELIC